MAVTSRSMTAEVERTLRTIFKRCVECPPGLPDCFPCPTGQQCILMTATCDACQRAVCSADGTDAPAAQGPGIGPIAGASVAGVVVLAVILFVVWRFGVRKRRQRQMEWMENEMLSQQKHTPVINTMRGDAASIRTRASVAGSFLSRASNVIQIAFIPGVINRSNGGSSHNSLAPVPPIPAQYANNKPKSPLANDGDFLLFRPGSTFSATSSRSGVRDTQYTQYTYGSRQSITPSLARSSMALEIYRDEGTPPPMPATTMLRAAPRMVSVRSTPGTTPNPNGTYDSPGNTPRTGTSATIVPQGFGSSPQHSRQHSRTHSRRNSSMSLSSNKGKGRFPVRSASADLTMSPPPLSGRRTPTVSSPLITTNLDSEDDEGSNPGDDDDDHARARQSLLQPSSATTRTESGSPTSPMTHSSSMRPMSSIMIANNPYTLDPTSTSSSFMQGGAFRTASNPPPQPITSPFFDASDLPPNSTGLGTREHCRCWRDFRRRGSGRSE
ncbi:uncharacterized protein K489DRAFT_90939 [Dissoconium aciculare CBS 342.82]|uniref:Membrane anchor Opy2 N-terminal domain-containing protein n=1 Tax=Dissoconium aciculare CBS 342.82 TaxID=1314786 RepID=A0A6J3LV88_9PEZI|nr:uncharacterized protein K489DRAFT_90939 [Dissoconium aciculare CBS 342.82]KAF1818542.1 hypothetical protein K489DRAFT_90939 [Dissoconium aciculare CBS 342.82]